MYIGDLTDLIKRGKNVIVMFRMDECGACKLAFPIFKTLEPKHRKFTFVELEVSKNEELHREYRITSFPTFIIFKNGKPTKRLNGFNQDGLVAALK